MKLGVIKGSIVGKNKDSDVNRRLLQVAMDDEEDVRTVELITQHGEDTNPANDCRVLIISIAPSYKIGVAITDELAPEVSTGEKEIYSTDNPATTKKARIKLGSNGNVIHNQGNKSAVSYAALNTALQSLVTAINSALATKLNGSGSAGTLTLDISAAESPTVKVP